MMNIEKGKPKFLSFFDIHHDGECQFFFLLLFFNIQHIVEYQIYFDFRFSIFIRMANVNFSFLLSFFDISQDAECQIFF